MHKLFILTRRDLHPGAQAAQSVHGAFAFAREHPEACIQWMDASNTVVLLSVPSETELHHMLHRATDAGIKHASFQEPDFADAMTAIVLEPGEATARLCKAERKRCRIEKTLQHAAQAEAA